MGRIQHKPGLNASGGAPTLLTLYSSFLVTISPRPALTHFLRFSSLKKPTWARKSPSQDEVPWGSSGIAHEKRFLSRASSEVATCYQRAGHRPPVVLSSPNYMMNGH
ncbi:hypothetical protein DUI87_10375 [Hirundo rustica rustica]|uniref:Uncharacterized protein n=1 Tax=Hirundo rustica rustica TaxID=333673 RepID=A0A3M0KPB1_HIRRU|nr:hypothetical protein DUI87_10375 [Hirundo rustica rustica]